MSLNTLIKDEFKPYLNIVCNNIKFHGSLLGINQFIVQVYSKSDFGIEIAGFITLTTNITYIIETSINMGTTRLNLTSGAQLMGNNTATSTILYSGTGYLLNGQDTSINIKNISVNCPNGGFLQYVDNVPQTNVIIFSECVFQNCVQGFHITNPLLFGHIRTNFYVGSVNNLFQFFGANFGDFIFYDNIIAGFIGTLFNLGTSIFNIIIISRNLIHVTAGQLMLDGLANSGNLSATGQALFNTNQLIESGTRLNNITTADVKWDFKSNGDTLSQIIDSTIYGATISISNATNTTFSLINTFAPLLSSNWIPVNLERFTLNNTTGELTATNNQTKRVTAICNIDLTSTAGTVVIDVAIFKNGSIISNIITSSEILATVNKPVTVICPTTCILNDVFQIFVRNITNTTAVLMTNLQFIIS